MKLKLKLKIKSKIFMMAPVLETKTVFTSQPAPKRTIRRLDYQPVLLKTA